jgi:hypothetical protein
MNKKRIHIAEKQPNGDFKLENREEKRPPEPPRDVKGMVDHLNATHGPTRKLSKKGEGDG